jgi:hypothetical protein
LVLPELGISQRTVPPRLLTRDRAVHSDLVAVDVFSGCARRIAGFAPLVVFGLDVRRIENVPLADAGSPIHIASGSDARPLVTSMTRAHRVRTAAAGSEFQLSDSALSGSPPD